MKNKGIYLDYAATTPVSERVFLAMEPYFSKEFANPSSLHIPGQRAQAALDEARQQVADILGASWKEIIFTASATESINLAIRGTIKATPIVPPGGTIPVLRHSERPKVIPHIVTTNIEHSAVLNTCHDLEKEGIEVTYLLVDKEGLITAKQVKEALKENTILVSIGYVNNEIGTIQPISDIANIIRDIRNYKHEVRNSKQIQNSKSKIQNKNISDFGFRSSDLESGYPLFHTDAVQAANYLDINVQNLGVDMMTLSGHKIYGPKGVGVLYKKDSVILKPIIIGGGQERELRAGTENIPAIVGFAEALKETEEAKKKEMARLQKLRDFFIDESLKHAKNIILNGSREYRVANNASFCFEGKKTETLIPRLDAAGIYVSGGSACVSRTLEASHVIEAIGKKKHAKSAVRFTLGRATTKKDIEKAIDIVIKLTV